MKTIRVFLIVCIALLTVACSIIHRQPDHWLG